MSVRLTIKNVVFDPVDAFLTVSFQSIIRHPEATLPICIVLGTASNELSKLLKRGADVDVTWETLSNPRLALLTSVCVEDGDEPRTWYIHTSGDGQTNIAVFRFRGWIDLPTEQSLNEAFPKIRKW